MNAIELKEVEIGYDKSPVLKGISLRVESGDFLGLIGPNGVGKSTLLRVMSGVLPAWKGEVIVQDKSILRHSRKELAKLEGVVPQQAIFSLPFTCLDIVLMGRFPYVRWFENKLDYETADWAMEVTNTYHLRERLIQEVSGGELQRVRIARVLAQCPKILLLDEPTAHLDIHHEIEVFELLKKLNTEGLTIILASHDLNTIGTYAKRLALLSEGKIVKLGSPAEVMRKELIEDVYQSPVIIKENPITGTPLVIPLPHTK